MKANQHPTIKKLAETPPDLLRFFSATERAVIEACKELINEKRADAEAPADERHDTESSTHEQTSLSLQNR